MPEQLLHLNKQTVDGATLKNLPDLFSVSGADLARHSGDLHGKLMDELQDLMSRNGSDISKTAAELLKVAESRNLVTAAEASELVQIVDQVKNRRLSQALATASSFVEKNPGDAAQVIARVAANSLQRGSGGIVAQTDAVHWGDIGGAILGVILGGVPGGIAGGVIGSTLVK